MHPNLAFRNTATQTMTVESVDGTWKLNQNIDRMSVSPLLRHWRNCRLSAQHKRHQS